MGNQHQPVGSWPSVAYSDELIRLSRLRPGAEVQISTPKDRSMWRSLADFASNRTASGQWRVQKRTMPQAKKFAGIVSGRDPWLISLFLLLTGFAGLRFPSCQKMASRQRTGVEAL